jgi:hypothetical protein
MADVKIFSVDRELPGMENGGGKWVADDTQQRAAWEIYVELVTRISVVGLRPNEGLLSEALSSLYTLFDSTRETLRRYGPEVAQPTADGTLSFGLLSLTLLNTVLRPVLAKWHPLLMDYESTRAENVSPLEHERNWDKNAELRRVLNEDVRGAMVKYADLFAQAAGVPGPTIKHELT